MTIKLDTGSIQVPRDHSTSLGFTRPLSGTIIEYNDTTPAETVVFPSKDRRMLRVFPNTITVVTGYNLIKETKVSFSKVLLSNGIPAQGTAACCPEITAAHTIALHRVELPCWVLDTCNPVFIIKTPGDYYIDVFGQDREVVITAMPFPMQDVNDFGNCKCIEPPPRDKRNGLGVYVDDPAYTEPLDPIDPPPPTYDPIDPPGYDPTNPDNNI